MCLVIDTQRQGLKLPVLHTADRDIVVYKVLKVKKSEQAVKYIAPYRSYYEYTMHELQKSELLPPEKLEESQQLNPWNETTVHLVFEGLHSCETKSQAYSMADIVKYFTGLKKQTDTEYYGVFKAVIPKGSKYYKGYFDRIDASTNYASDQLIILEEVKKED